MGFNDDLV
jgi:hypothetical protein